MKPKAEMKLKDKVAIITGSSRGIGKAIAILFAKEGAKVVVNYNRSEREALNVADEIERLGSEVITYQADVSNPEQVREMIDRTIGKFGRVDILVNNAGIVIPKEFSRITVEDWRKTFDVNVLGVFLCSQTVSPFMLKQKYGKIVNISSIRGLGHCGRTGIFDYNVSKASVINFTKTLAKELSPFVNVNSVAPGWVETEMNKKIGPELRETETEKTYLKRFAKPEEIASAVLFLASDDASYITGQVLIVDGGYSLK